MAKRTTVYNNIVGEKYALVNNKNKALLKEWVEYLHSVDRSNETVAQYENDYRIWAVWNYDNAEDKEFFDINKRDVMRFQSYCLNELGHSPARVRRLRATLSSLSNYIENILDEDYPNFRNIIGKIEAPTLEPVREKLVMEDVNVEEALEKLTASGKHQQACFLALAVYGGARKSEILRFKVDYFKEECIENGLYKTPEKIKTKGRGKRGKQLNKYTIVKYFKPYLENWLKEREELGIESEWLFVRDVKGKYEQAIVSTADSWSKTIGRFMDENFYAHASRHMYVTRMYKAGIPAEVIKQIGGWESVEMVSTYTDVDVSDELGKYFSDDGIKQVEKKDLSSL